MIATQKDIETLTILSKFNEAQEIVNAVVKQNDSTLKMEREYLKCRVQEFETFLTKRNRDLTEELKSMADEVIGLKSQFLFLEHFSRRSFEELWSEIIEKDCTISVMNVCSMGIIRDLMEPNSLASSGLAFVDKEQLFEEYCFQDLQRCIFQSELREKAKETKVKSSQLVILERERSHLLEILDNLKQEIIFLAFEEAIGRKLSLDLEAENANLEEDATRVKNQLRERDDVIREMQVKMDNLQCNRQQFINQEMEFKNQISQLQMEVRDSAQSHEVISKDLSSKSSEIQFLNEKMSAMTSELHILRREKVRVLEELLWREKDLSSASCNLSSLEQQNHKLEDEIEFLRFSISSLERELEKKNVEMAAIKDSHSRISVDLESEKSRVEALTSRFDALEREYEKLKNEVTLSNTEESEILLHSLRDEHTSRTSAVDKAIRQCQLLAVQITEKSAIINSLESNLSKEIGENADLKSQLAKKGKLLDELELEFMEASNLLKQKDHLLERLVEERERVESTITMLQERLEMAQALAEEHDAIAIEAKQVAFHFYFMTLLTVLIVFSSILLMCRLPN